MAESKMINWLPRKRDYELERRNRIVKMVPVTDDHPLRGTVVTNVSGSNVRATQKVAPIGTAHTPMLDPLSLLAAGATEDTLSVMSCATSSTENVHGDHSKSASAQGSRRGSSASIKSQKFGNQDGFIDDTFEPWASKRSGILNKYTTSEKLSIKSTFLSGEEVEAPTPAEVVINPEAAANQPKTNSTTTTSDKLRNRLEQLDELEAGSEKVMLDLSQTEYVNRIEELNNELNKAWGAEQRVKSLKIAIQCSKLLGDVSVMQFYPSKFVLITDILDNFGKLVFDRIHTKSTITESNGRQVHLPVNFSPSEVPESAKETCRNWFYKVASIRELIPRLYPFHS